VGQNAADFLGFISFRCVANHLFCHDEYHRMNCKDFRALETVVVTQTAPGYLSGYTKIVRFLPRYVVVNNLPHGVRLWQHNSIFRPASSESTSIGTAAESASKLWRFHPANKSSGKNKVNQYEVLWGREAILSQDEDVDKMPAGTTAHHAAYYVATVLPSTWRPFNIPDSRGDRLLRIDLGGLWNLTASISADVPGEHTLRISSAIDLRLFKHASTRASPHYDVRLPPSGESVFAGELGIWFETEWGTDRSLIVKDLKKDFFCFNKTDVHVGDELLLIDGAPVARMTFAEAMNVLRNRLGELRTQAQQQAQQNEPPLRRTPMRRGSIGFAISSRFPGNKPAVEEGSGQVRPLRLTFRTVEERLRRVRLKAAKSNAGAVRLNPASDGTPAAESDPQYGGELSRTTEPTFMKAELRTLHHSLFLVLGQDPAVPYQVQNRSSSSTIYFRQRGCNGHPWRCLKPGASELYAWEEPMKPRRLSVRVATDSAYSFVNDGDADDFGNASSVPSTQSGEKPDVENKIQPSIGNGLFRTVKDEEDDVFSPSVSVRLEEIGFREFLSCGRRSDGAQGEQRHLQLEVDVASSTRVLVVHDVSSEDGVEQMIRHLESLRNKCTHEERRNNELRAMKSVLSVSSTVAPLSSYSTVPNDPAENDAPADTFHEEAIIESATNLMLDFPEETTISRKHKIVVEVIEAIGLSPDDFVGTCNPYVELYLKSRTARKSLFSEQDVRRTYYVRKSINPTWNSQSFVFDVPPDAVSVTRGHAVKLKLRNYRRVGNHNVLGRAQVDLHSVRNQEPLLGWFPLAGRSGGRRDLENSLSHWGRGSIKLRVHWIYSTPALFDYFIMLSDARLLDLQESAEGMANQLEKKKEDDQKRREGMDGFKAVRVNDMLPTRRQSMQQKRFQAPKLDDVLKIIEPIRPGFRRNRRDYNDYSEFDESDSTLESVRAGPTHLCGDVEMKKKLALAQLKTASASLHDLEDRITMQRQSFQSLAAKRQKTGKRPSCVVLTNYGGKLELASFTSWTAAQKLFNHKDLDIQVKRGDIVAELKPKSRTAPDPEEGLTGSRRVLARKLHLPASIPTAMALAARDYASSFAESRSSLERSARRSLRAALNPGGWLTIRPVQALNLPDSYNGMHVKLRYGAETLLSETVDSTVYPTWIKANPQQHNIPAESLEFFPNDLHIYVAPQKTSGSIRLSVVGEGRHQSLTTRTELGVLHIPLGAAIAACIDCIEEFLDLESEESPSSPVYVRWFPLMSPKDSVPVEGDRGLGWRPRESEKTADDLFKEYFAPCIQLALIWSPDVELSDADAEDEATGCPRLGPAFSSHHPSLVALTGGATRMVEKYFNADIGQISAALIDSQRTVELAAIAVSDIDVRCWVTKAKTRFGLAVGWVQLDQQDEAAREPVMVAPTPHDFVSTVVQILAVKDNLRSKTDVLSFEFIDVSIAEFDLTMEESFLFDLFDFFSSLRLRRGKGLHSSLAQGTGVDIIAVGQGQSLLDLENPVDESNEPTLYSMLTGEGRNTKGETRVYIEQLFLGVVKFNLSYLKGKKEKEGWKANETGWTDLAMEDAAKVALIATGETLIRTFSYYHEKSDIFTGWSQHTSHEDRVSEGRGKSFSILCSICLAMASHAQIRSRFISQINRKL
jgi:C2 domain